jgi:F0F1-type ATP synthase assembly protein I
MPPVVSTGSLEIGHGVSDMEQSPERGPFAMFGALTGIATLSAALVVGGAVLGLLVDRATSAPHVFVFAGLVLGVLAAVLATRDIVRRFFR